MKAYPFNCLWCLCTVKLITMTLRLVHPASPEEDFQLLSEEVTFAVGETTKNVSLVIYDDEWVEFKEEFLIRLVPVDMLLLGSHSTFYILDNDSSLQHKVDLNICVFVRLYMFLLYVCVFAFTCVCNILSWFIIFIIAFQSFFTLLIGLHVGITSATIITSPSYALEICVSTTSGILQSGITLTVSLTAAVQAQG